MEPETVANPAAPGTQPVGSETADKVDWASQAAELKRTLDATQTSLDAMKTENDRNLRRLQSTYQGKINSLSAQSDEDKQRWEEAYHREKMAGMEEAEALRYDNSRLSKLVEEREQRMRAIQQQAADAQAAAGYLQQFTALGVPVTRLNTGGSLQDLADSGWTGLQEVRAQERRTVSEYDGKLSAIQTQLDALKKGGEVLDPNQLARSAGDLNPPNVATLIHGNPTVPRTELQALEAAAQYFNGVKPTLEQLYRAVETRQLPASVLPGLEGMPLEELKR